MAYTDLESRMEGAFRNAKRIESRAAQKALEKAKGEKKLKVHNEGGGMKFSSSYGAKNGKRTKFLHAHRVTNPSFDDYGGGKPNK